MSDLAALESDLHAVVSERVSEQMAAAHRNGARLPDETDQLMLASEVVHRELADRAVAAISAGQPWMAKKEETALAERVTAGLVSPLVALRRVMAHPAASDLYVNSWEHPELELTDGTRMMIGPFVRSNDELVAWGQDLARRAGARETAWNPSRPDLELDLPDLIRMTASNWYTNAPYFTFRRHGDPFSSLGDLATRGMFDAGIASLLRSLVRARKNLMFCGGHGVGKTTLLRATADECPVDERIAVLEQQRELHLDQRPGRRPYVRVFFETAPNMEGEGGRTLADIARTIKRHNQQRILVGEVRGPEVIPMLEVMTQGVEGCMCTLHARSPASALNRLAVYARIGGDAWRTEDVWELAAEAIDFIIFLRHPSGGDRVVAEICRVIGFDPVARRVTTAAWFPAGPDGRAHRDREVPIPVDMLDELISFGYDPTLHPDGSGAQR